MKTIIISVLLLTMTGCVFTELSIDKGSFDVHTPPVITGAGRHLVHRRTTLVTPSLQIGEEHTVTLKDIHN